MLKQTCPVLKQKRTSETGHTKKKTCAAVCAARGSGRAVFSRGWVPAPSESHTASCVQVEYCTIDTELSWNLDVTTLWRKAKGSYARQRTARTSARLRAAQHVFTRKKEHPSFISGRSQQPPHPDVGVSLIFSERLPPCGVFVVVAQHLPRTRKCWAAHAQPLASCGAPLRSERAPFGTHGGRADATSLLSRYSHRAAHADF